MAPIPYVFFPGTCAEAMAAYAEIFQTDPPEIMGMDQMPPEAREGMEGMADDAVMHAQLKLGDGFLYASDAPPGSGTMQGCYVHVALPESQAKAVFDALAKGGEVGMAFAPTFWAKGFGDLVDRFGTRWMISTDA